MHRLLSSCYVPEALFWAAELVSSAHDGACAVPIFVFALYWNYMKYASNTARRNTLAVALISALMAAAPAMAQDKATNLDVA